MKNDTIGWRYNKKTGLPELTGLPMYSSETGILRKTNLNFVLLFIYKMAKAVSSSIERIFPTGVDGKKIIKQ